MGNQSSLLCFLLKLEHPAQEGASKHMSNSKPPHKYTTVPIGDYDHDDDRGQLFERRIKEQDSNLDVLGHSAARLGELSLNISKEIDLQNRMLSSLEVEVEDAHNKADSLTRRTSELVKKSGGPKWFAVIVCLIIILIFLFFLVIYT